MLAPNVLMDKVLASRDGLQFPAGFHHLRPQQRILGDRRTDASVLRWTALSLLYIKSNTGQLVPLDSVSKLTQDLGPLAVNHSRPLPPPSPFRLTSSRVSRWGRP